MEAAIWTANHCAELIMLDKFKKNLSLNIEFKGDAGITPLLKFIKPAALISLAPAGLKSPKRII
jgi:hypothetical protein